MKPRPVVSPKRFHNFWQIVKSIFIVVWCVAYLKCGCEQSRLEEAMFDIEKSKGEDSGAGAGDAGNEEEQPEQEKAGEKGRNKQEEEKRKQEDEQRKEEVERKKKEEEARKQEERGRSSQARRRET